MNNAYKVPFVDYPTHYHNIKKKIDTAIMDVLEGGDFILRHQLAEFEENIASFVGTKYAIGVNSGTDALLLSLLAAGISQGDEVITVAHTFVASVAVIVHSSAIAVLVDIGEDFNMDMAQLERVITLKTKAIMPVHLNGRLCDMEKLTGIAHKYGLLIIEDAAQSLGAEFNKQKAGSFGLTGCFSFYPAKVLGGIGDSGMVTTNNKEIADKIRLLRDHCVQRDTGELLGYGFNSRLDNLQAAILDVKLKYLPKWIERRREIAAMYEQGLTDIEQVRTPPAPANNQYYDVYTNYVIQAEQRDSLAKYLKREGVETIISWAKPMHLHENLELNFKLPKTEEISRKVISLPLNTEINNEQVAYVIKAIQEFYLGV